MNQLLSCICVSPVDSNSRFFTASCRPDVWIGIRMYGGVYQSEHSVSHRSRRMNKRAQVAQKAAADNPAKSQTAHVGYRLAAAALEMLFCTVTVLLSVLVTAP